MLYRLCYIGLNMGKYIFKIQVIKWNKSHHSINNESINTLLINMSRVFHTYYICLYYLKLSYISKMSLIITSMIWHSSHTLDLIPFDFFFFVHSTFHLLWIFDSHFNIHAECEDSQSRKNSLKSQRKYQRKTEDHDEHFYWNV